MNSQLAIVLALLLGSMLLFIRNKPRMDVVALLVIVALPLSGVLSVPETLTGFSDPNVLLIAALFVIGDGLVRTGIAYRLGDWLADQAGSSESRLIALLMLTVATLGSVMSSTGVVAIFIPVLMSVSLRTDIPASRLMMPLSFAGLMSGMLTLVATPPNLVVNSELARHGLPGFSFFSFTPIGLVVLACGIAYMLVVRRWLGGASGTGDEPERQTLHGLAELYRLLERERRLKLNPGSPLVARPLNELQLRSKYGINVIAIERQQRFRSLLQIASSTSVLQPGDILLVDMLGPAPHPAEAFAEIGVTPLPLGTSYYDTHSHQLGLAEVALPPESRLAGRSIRELTFRSKHRLSVVGLRRDGEALQGLLLNEKLKAGDTLLVTGNWKDIDRLHLRTRDFVVLSLPQEIKQMVPAARKAPYALLSLGVMVTLMVSGVVPNLLAALIGCLLMGAFKCVTMDSAYKAIHWPSLLLIVGMLPFAVALQKTGGIDLVVDGLLGLFGNAGPRALLATLFVATALTGLFISNTATAVLMAPVAVATAQALDASPYPFVMTVALAASAAFMTPVSSPVNTLVLDPGGYRFSDFLRVGIPFTGLVLLITVGLVPVLFSL